ncbi:ATP/GTP-binding protein [Streptomyces sp. 21So2-11]|uniref:ATP/GTP-binding protein n=1 Tax=Streptomyces sp. 21So2-11 TaxID=3144408 RepID=UPI00321A0103
MLRWRIILVGALAATSLGSGAHIAVADGDCPEGQRYCQIEDEIPGVPDKDTGTGTGSGGSGDSGGAGGEPSKCFDDKTEVPCRSESFGWYMGDGCYAKALDPQPPADDPAFDGRPKGGAIYTRICLNGENVTSQGWIWLQQPPNEEQISPAQLAQQVLAKVVLDGPAIGIAPKPGNTGVVGMPVWMWTTVTPETWGPNSASASAGGLTVTGTAQAKKIDWNMGDGTTVTCTTAGTPYTALYGKKKSPDCGHTYTTSSADQANENFKITATTTWNFHWEGGGEQGDIEVTRTSDTTARIGEVQVVGD